jgi:hypothetical protein
VLGLYLFNRGSLQYLFLQIKCLENENEQLEKNEKELKDNMEGLLQSKEAFIKHYEAGVYLYFPPSFCSSLYGAELIFYVFSPC